MNSNNILSLTLSEGKLIFGALAELPFKVVFELIGKINQQTNEQQTNYNLDEIKLKLTKKEIEIIIEALSEQPFIKVSALMDKIRKQEVI